MTSDSETAMVAKTAKGKKGGTTRKDRGKPRRDLDGSILLPEQMTGPSGETTRNVRRSLEAPFNIASIGVSLVNQEMDDARSVDMDLGREVADLEARFKLEVRDILNELRDRSHRKNDRVAAQERRLGHLEDLDKRIKLLDRGIASRDSAIRRVENDVRTLTRGLNNLSVRVYEIHENVEKNNKDNEKLTETMDALREDQNTARTQIARNRDDIAELRTRGNNINPENSHAHIKYNLPIFWAAPVGKPVHFLRALVNYLAAVKASPENFKYIIEQSLRGPAYEWWENIESYVTSVRDFRERFTAKYWGERVQIKYVAS